MREKCALISELKKLKESSKEAIEGIEKFSEFKQYMHIETKVEEELIYKLQHVYNANQKKCLILVCGSVGDGKSHVISQLKNSQTDLLKDFTIHNDATESNNPKKNFKEVLDDLFNPFSDNELESDEEYKLLVAINLGTLSNFIEDANYKEKYKKLSSFVNKNKIIEDEIVPEYEHPVIKYVNFSDYSLFDLSVNGPTSYFIKSLISRITQKSKKNPFYMNYNKYCLSECEFNKSCPLKSNFEIFSVIDIQESIIQLIIESIIKYKNIVSVRSLLDFIYSILVPMEFEKLVDKDQLSKLVTELYVGEFFWRLLLPNALFENRGRNSLFDSLYKLDPLNDRVEEIDNFIVEINTLEDKNIIFNSRFDYGNFNIINQIMKKLYLNQINNSNLNQVVKTYIRTARLLNDHLIPIRQTYVTFVKELYYYNINDVIRMKQLYSDVIDAIYKWNGKTENNWINIDDTAMSKEFSVSQELKITHDIKEIKQVDEDKTIYKFESNIKINLKDSKAEESIRFIIDYDLYELLHKVKNGYKLNSRDKENYIAFIDSLSSLMSQGEKRDRVKILHKSVGNKDEFYLERDGFGGYKFGYSK